MKTINYTILGLFLIISQLAVGQLKVTNQGHVGIGTNVPWERLHVANGSVIIANNGRSLRLWPWIGVYVGSNYGTVGMWEKDSKWNNVNAKHYHVVSDASLKTDVKPIINALNIINQLKGVYFRYKNDSVVLPKNSSIDLNNDYSYGFIAQDVETVLPESVIETSQNVKAVDYNSITPILVEAFKQQQQIIETMQQRLDSITTELNLCCNSLGLRTINNTDNGMGNNVGDINLDVLFQNNPNPFKEKTIIEYKILNTFSNAYILVFDLQGALIKNIPINNYGLGQIIINGNELKAGMYVYSLIVDNKIMDTKRMILLE